VAHHAGGAGNGQSVGVEPRAGSAVPVAGAEAVACTEPCPELVEGSGLLESLLRLFANAINRLVEQVRTERQLSQLNAYLTVSSMLARSLGLHELLEIALYCCIELVSAKGVSVLLLDDEKKNFCIYHAEGTGKLALEGATFPADKRHSPRTKAWPVLSYRRSRQRSSTMCKFAIRNAKVFEYVVNSYCKQRQGQPSCQGCQRPLGSWTPCVKYREVSI